MAFFFIISGVVIRVLSHYHYIPSVPNFAPIAAMALFGGVYLNKNYALLIPILALFLSDLFIGLYSPWIMLSVYGSFLVIGLIGLWLKKRKRFPMVIGATLAGSIMFFIVTNFAMWAIPNSLYQHNISGFLSCYEMAIPFFRNTLMGDFFYVGAMFGLMEVAIKISKKDQVVKLRSKLLFLLSRNYRIQ